MKDKSKKVKRKKEDIVPSGTASTEKTRRDEEIFITKSDSNVIPVLTTQITPAGIPIGGGIVLNDKKYKVINVIARFTGKAEVYLIERENQKYVFKYYHPVFKPNDTILQQLKGLTHENIISLIDYGYYHNRFFEILEYAEGGALMDTNPDGTYRYIPIKDMKRIKQIVKEIVNALEFCHSRGIIHRNINPENIFFANPDGIYIKIGSFNILQPPDARVLEDLPLSAIFGIYDPPEWYQNVRDKRVISKEVDYYALGISLIHIFSGEVPFKDLAEFAIMKIKCDGKVDIPDDAPEDLRTLIKGLITVEPSKRWGYNEVQKWLVGETVLLDYEIREQSSEPSPSDRIERKDIIAQNSVKEILKELDSLVGMENIKTGVGNLINRIRIQKERAEQLGETYKLGIHIVMTGNPGTGKTTVARK
ncbi:MAG: protein kinase, partial [candidate division WOR-3 bacterium]